MISIDGLPVDAAAGHRCLLSCFADDRFIFQAIATTPVKGLSHSEQLTGTHALQNGIIDGRLKYSTLAGRLREEGYASAAFVTERVLGRAWDELFETLRFMMFQDQSGVKAAWDADLSDVLRSSEGLKTGSNSEGSDSAH